MKILEVISSMNPNGGGPVESIRQLGTTLVSSGHRVEIATLDPPTAPFLRQSALPIHALGPGNRDTLSAADSLRGCAPTGAGMMPSSSTGSGNITASGPGVRCVNPIRRMFFTLTECSILGSRNSIR